MVGGVPPDPQQMARMERLAELARTLPQTQAQVQAAQAREAVRLAEEARRQAQAAQRREVLAQVQAQAREAQAQAKKATKKKTKKVAPRADSAGGDPKRVKKESALKMTSKETKRVLDTLEASPPSSPAPSEDSYFRDALDALAEDDSDDFDFEGMEGMGRGMMGGAPNLSRRKKLDLLYRRAERWLKNNRMRIMSSDDALFEYTEFLAEEAKKLGLPDEAVSAIISTKELMTPFVDALAQEEGEVIDSDFREALDALAEDDAEPPAEYEIPDFTGMGRAPSRYPYLL